MVLSPLRQIAGADVRAEINVTPLVDVCLVLLIIFMVVTPLIRQGVEVTLPATAAPATLGDDNGRIALSIRADRSVWVDSVRIEPGSLTAALRSRVAASSGARFLVRGDRSLRYADVRAVLGRLNEAGVASAELATMRRSTTSLR
jgi:biopolymer transport protein ExbD